MKNMKKVQLFVKVSEFEAFVNRQDIEILQLDVKSVEWLEDEYYTLDYHRQCLRLLEEDGENLVNQSDYMLIGHLLEWQFDVFGLIDEGLAIDVNTLNQK